MHPTACVRINTYRTTKSLSIGIRQSLSSVSQEMNIEAPVLESDGEALEVKNKSLLSGYKVVAITRDLFVGNFKALLAQNIFHF